MGSISDRYPLKLGRRRLFILLLSIGELSLEYFLFPMMKRLEIQYVLEIPVPQQIRSITQRIPI